MREKYIAELIRDPAARGLDEVKFIHAPQIFTTRSVRYRCQLACGEAHHNVMSPPATPDSEETRRVLDEYRYGLLVRRGAPLGVRPPRETWQEFGDAVLALEAEAFEQGYPGAFAAGIGTCIYQHLDDSLRPCDYPGKRRPTLEALGIDIRDTLEIVHWAGYITRERDEDLQMLAIVLLE